MTGCKGIAASASGQTAVGHAVRHANANVSDWQQRVGDHSASAGNASVEIVFGVSATTVVNRPGWLVDDIAIEHCEAVSVELQSFGIE